MKKNFIIAGLLIAGLYNAQQNGSVGINTKTPSGATLQVEIAADASPADGQGVAVPNVTKTTLNAMEKGKIAISALVYVTNASATDVATTGKVKEVGYHYFDGTEWVKLGGGASSSSSANLYTENGTLSSARTVTQNNQHLTFATGITGRTIVDGNFETKGGVYAKYRDAGLPGDAASSLSDDDYILIITPTSTTQTFTFPTYNTDDEKKKYDGRILCLKNSSGTAFGVRNIKSPGNATAVQGTSGLCYVYDKSANAWQMFSGR